MDLIQITVFLPENLFQSGIFLNYLGKILSETALFFGNMCQKICILICHEQFKELFYVSTPSPSKYASKAFC